MIELPNVTEYWKNFSLENLSEIYEGELIIEEWKPVVGYESRYQVSSFGRVKSLFYKKTNKHGILKQSKNSSDYLRVDLVTKINHQYVHILVAKAFIPNPGNKPEVNHKLGVTIDNRASQLEWATKREQQIHAHQVLGFKPTSPPKSIMGGNNPKAKKINQYSLTGQLIKQYDCIMDAERGTGVPNTRIVCAAKGKYKTAGGFIWAYA